MKKTAGAAILVVAALSQSAPLFGQAPSIVIYSFEDIAVSRGAQVGQKLGDRLLSKLTASGAYQVFDRQFLEKVMIEHGLSPAAFNTSTALQAGKLANVAAIVDGTITTFTFNQRSSEDSLGTYGTVTLAATARVISTGTGAIVKAPITSNSARGLVQLLPPAAPKQSCKQKNWGIGYVCTTPATSAPPSVETKTMEQLLDEAIEACAQSLATEIARASSSVPSSRPTVAPLAPRPTPEAAAAVIGVADGLAYISRGASAGLKVGQIVSVYRIVPSGLNSPEDNRPLTRKSQVCALTLTDVEPHDASGKCSGSVPAKGDLVEVRAQ